MPATKRNLFTTKNLGCINLGCIVAAALLALAGTSAATAQTPAVQYGLVVTPFVGGSGVCAAAANTSGDGCPATQATVNSPHIGDFDAAGNFYFTDSNTAANLGRIRRVDVHTGIITTVAGGAATVCAAATNTIGDGCPATQATLNVPHGVKVDVSGNLYIADSSNNRIRFVNALTGIITTVVGTGTAGSGPYTNSTPPMAGAIQLNAPNDIAVDPAGNLYISQATSYYIVLVTAVNGVINPATSAAYALAGTGTAGFSGDGSASTAAKVNSGRGVALDRSGNLFFSDYTNNRIRKITSPFQGGVLNLAGSIITTYAGVGTSGTSGDGGLATAASVNSPEALATDAQGNVYIDCVNAGSAFIRKVTAATGVITSIAGTGAYGNTGDGGPATKATFSGEIGVSVDPFGSIYVVDTGNNRLRKLSLDTAAPATPVGSSSAPQSLVVQLNQAVTPQSFAFPAAGKDYSSASITGCTIGTSAAAGSLCSVAATFQPTLPGLRATPLIFSDGGTNTVAAGVVGLGLAPNLTFTPATITTLAGTGTAGNSAGGGVGTSAQISGPRGGSVDSLGILYFADTANHQVRRLVLASGAISTVAGTGAAGFSGDSGPAGAAQLSSPSAVVEDASGNLYIADSGNNRIRIVNGSTGNITTLAGTGTAGYSGDGGFASAAQLSSPAGLALDSLGNLFIADTGNHAIRRLLLSSGLISTAAGTGTAGYSGDSGPAIAATLRSPAAVATDPSGNLYIADTGNSVIRKVSAAGTIGTVAGTSSITSNSGDGGLATAAGLKTPTDLAVDASGSLFIMAGNVVRHVDSGGSITTAAGNAAAGTYQGDGGLATSATLGSSANNLMLDGAGNLYIAATSSHRFVEVTSAQAPALSFGSINVGSSSPAQLLTLTNNGNLPLTFSALTLPAGFQQQSTGTSDCSATTTLQAGQGCALAVVFHPAAPGPLSAQASITDNALNGTPTQTISLSGTGTVALSGFSVTGPGTSVTAGVAFAVTVSALGSGGPNTSYRGTLHLTSSDAQAVLPADYTFTAADAGVHTFTGLALKSAGSQSVTVIDTVQSTQQGSAYTVVAAGPAASIAVSGLSTESAQVSTAFAAPLVATLLDAYANAVPNASVTFTAPASGASALFTGSGTTVAVTSNAAGLATSPGLTANASAGTYSVTASAAGVTTPAAFTLTNYPAKVATTVTLSSSPATPVVGQSLTLTATLTFTGSGSPTGMVSFYDGKTLLSTLAVTAQGTAAFTSSTLAVGSHTLTAVYTGDSSFLGATSAALVLTLKNPPDFSLAATPTTLTLVRGETGVYAITLTPLNGYSGSASLSCGTLPALVTCSFHPATLIGNATNTPVQGLLTVSTGTKLADAGHVPPTSPLTAPQTYLAVLLLAACWWRRKSMPALRLLLLLTCFGLAIGTSGCGSAPISAAGTTQFVVTVTDSSLNLSHALNLTLTLQ